MSEETRISSQEEKTALDDNELFTKLKKDMQDVLMLTRRVRQAQRESGPLTIMQIAGQASEKIENVRSELYLLQEAIEDLREEALVALRN